VKDGGLSRLSARNPLLSGADECVPYTRRRAKGSFTRIRRPEASSQGQLVGMVSG